MASKETNSTGTVFEFVVADGDIFNFWRFKAMNIGFESIMAPVEPALDTCQVCPSGFRE